MAFPVMFIVAGPSAELLKAKGPGPCLILFFCVGFFHLS
jgi:hypothetical protein